MARRTAKSKTTQPKPEPDAQAETPANEAPVAVDTQDQSAPEGGADTTAGETADQVAPEDASTPEETDGAKAAADAGANAPADDAATTETVGSEDDEAPNPGALEPRQIGADETLEAGPSPVAVPSRELRMHTALCHVWRDGDLMPPGTPLLLTETEFAELKLAKAVDGEW